MSENMGSDYNEVKTIFRAAGLDVRQFSTPTFTNAVSQLTYRENHLGVINLIGGEFRYDANHPYCSVAETSWLDKKNNVKNFPVRLLTVSPNRTLELLDGEFNIPFKTEGEYTGLVTFNNIDATGKSIKVPYLVSHPIIELYESPDEEGAMTLWHHSIMTRRAHSQYQSTQSQTPVSIIQRIARLNYKILESRGINIPHIDAKPPYQIEDIPISVENCILNKILIRFIDTNLAAKRWFLKGLAK